MNAHVSAKTLKASTAVHTDEAPARGNRLGFDMTALSIPELAAVADGMRIFGDIACGLADQPRVLNRPAGNMLSDLIEQFAWEGQRAVDALVSRVPVNDDERETQELTILAAATQRTDSFDEALDWAHRKLNHIGEASPSPSDAAAVPVEEARDHYTLDDLHCDIWNLHELLDTISDVFCGMDFAVPGGGRNRELDRVSSLTRVAMDQAKMLGKALDAGLDVAH